MDACKALDCSQTARQLMQFWHICIAQQSGASSRHHRVEVAHQMHFVGWMGSKVAVLPVADSPAPARASEKPESTHLSTWFQRKVGCRHATTLVYPEIIGELLALPALPERHGRRRERDAFEARGPRDRERRRALRRDENFDPFSRLSSLSSQVTAGSESGEETENGTGPSAASAASAGAGSATDPTEARRIGLWSYWKGFRIRVYALEGADLRMFVIRGGAVALTSSLKRLKRNRRSVELLTSPRKGFQSLQVSRKTRGRPTGSHAVANASALAHRMGCPGRGLN